MDPGNSLRVTVTDGRGRPIPAGGLARWLAAIAPASARGDVGVALVTDRHIRQLNRQYRRKDVPTDVLSFPADPPKPDGPPGRRPARPRHGSLLGDIVIAIGVARRQARAAGHGYRTELRVLALHGLLHLLGYDHDQPDDRGRMGRVEATLRRKGKLREGLIARSRVDTERLRPARAAGGKRGGAAPASARRAGVPASAGREHRGRPATARSRRSAGRQKSRAREGGGPHAHKE